MSNLRHVFQHIVVIAVLALVAITGAAADEPIIIDHRSTDVSLIPQDWIDLARNDPRVGYPHTSHGSQLVTGMEAFCFCPGYT